VINEISISQAGTYGREQTLLSPLKKINYIYGANGAGKTTLSKIIGNLQLFPNCKISWVNGRTLTSFVYNRDFVNDNFQQDNIKGVFTLGENANGIQDVIDALIIKRAKEQDAKDSMKNQLEVGSDKEISVINQIKENESNFKNNCWKQKIKHDEYFQKAFKGVRSNTVNFRDRVIAEKKNNTSPLLTLAELIEKSKAIFSDELKAVNKVPYPNFEILTRLNSSGVLMEVIVGKEDTIVSELIKTLNNSDWIRQGLKYYDSDHGVCPFCQQSMEESIKDSLESYFDKTYEKKKEEVNLLIDSLEANLSVLQGYYEGVINEGNEFLDINVFESLWGALIIKIRSNISSVKNKLNNLSKPIELESLEDDFHNIRSLINSANSNIDENNKLFANITTEEKKLTSEVWSYIVKNELKDEIDDFFKKDKALSSRKEGLEKGIVNKEISIGNINEEISNEERKRTSVRPTIDEINKIIRSFGFKNFYLDCASDDYHYTILREDGSNALDTLSEGEKTFVTFLYFFCLIKGSTAATGVMDERIVVFDDPVSSLDSDILFIVSSLMKKIVKDVRDGKDKIKQFFCLTHNIYFHKELTFDMDRGGETARPFETFWVVRKKDGISYIESHESNPVKNSYDLLWSELRRKDSNCATIQNTMRRILENYFKILGGVDVWRLEEHFDGEEKLIFKALFSWVNDGSHYSGDDLFLMTNDNVVDKYKLIFQKAFELSEHKAHFKMMMGTMYTPLPSSDDGGTMVNVEISANDPLPDVI